MKWLYLLGILCLISVVGIGFTLLPQEHTERILETITLGIYNPVYLTPAQQAFLDSAELIYNTELCGGVDTYGNALPCIAIFSINLTGLGENFDITPYTTITFEDKYGSVIEEPFTYTVEIGIIENVSYPVNITTCINETNETQNCTTTPGTEEREEVVYNGLIAQPGINYVRIISTDKPQDFWTDWHVLIDGLVIQGANIRFDTHDKGWAIWGSGSDFDTWEYRFSVVVNESEVQEDLTGFPIYVDLSKAPAGFWANHTGNDCGDIRVTNESNSELAREIVYCDTTAEEGQLYFKADSISSTTNTTFYIYYGNDSSDYATTATYGAENVWTDFITVYHFQQASGTVLDSTGNSNDLGTLSNVVYGIDAGIGNAVSVSSTNGYLRDLTITGLTSVDTLTKFVWLNQTRKESIRVVERNWQSTVADRTTGMYFRDIGAGTNLSVNSYNVGCNIARRIDYDGYYNKTTFISYTKNSTHTAVWLDDTQVYDQADSCTWQGYSTGNIQQSILAEDSRSSTQGNLDAEMTEYRITTSVKSDAYVGTTYNMEKPTNNQFLTYGAHETQPGGTYTFLNITKSAVDNVTNGQWFTYTVQVTCTGGDCGNTYVYLDPRKI